MTTPRAIVCAALLAGLTLALGWSGAGVDIVEGGEAREGLVAREMLETGDWILPLWNGTTIPSKPPLFHWLVAGVAHASGAGVTERTLRAPSIVLAAVIVLTVCGAGWLWAGPSVGLLAALVLATTPQLLKEAVDGRVDMTLTAAVTLAQVLLIEAFRRESGRILPVALAVLLALAMLAKGPVGPALVGLTALAVAAGTRSMRPLGRLARPLPIALFALIAGSWYGLAVWHRGWDFVAKQIVSENGEALLGSDRFPWRSPFYYVGGVLAGELPWTLVLPWAVVGAWRGGVARRGCLLWALAVFVLFSLAPLKRGAYMLPLRPALALVVGWWLAEVVRSDVVDDRAVRPVRVLAAVVGGFAVVVAILGLLASAGLVPAGALRGLAARYEVDAEVYLRAIADRAGKLVLVGGVGACAAAGVARAAAHARWARVAIGAAAAVVAGTIVVRDVYSTGLTTQQSVRPFVLAVRAHVGPDDPLTLMTMEEMAEAGLPFVFYAGRHVPIRPAPGSRPPDVAAGFYVLDQVRWDAWGDPDGWEEVVRGPHHFSRHRRDLVLVRRLP